MEAMEASVEYFKQNIKSGWNHQILTDVLESKTSQTMIY